MRLLFNDNKGDKNIGTTRIMVYDTFNRLKSLGLNVKLNLYDRYNEFDVVIFGKSMPIEEFRMARLQNPRILVGSIHPSDYTTSRVGILKESDFFVVGSIEERDYYYRYSSNVYYMPLIESIFDSVKLHIDKSPIVLGYHGNLDHLTHFDPFLKEALEALSKEISIKLLVIYNKKELGIWNKGRPDINIEDVQWKHNAIKDVLLQCDIGLVPGTISINRNIAKAIYHYLKYYRKYRGVFPNDYLLRFKNTTNAGRAFVFHQLGIPVVSDFIPSCFHILANPKCGYLVNSAEGWLFALRDLCESAEKRQEIARNALIEFNRLYDPLEWSTQLYKNIEYLWKKTSRQIY